MNVGIVGSRHYENSAEFRRLIAEILPAETTLIISGGARGVDSLAAWYASNAKINFHMYTQRREKGETFTERAHARNQKIVDAADLLIALPCPCSKGTHDTIRRMRSKGGRVIVREVNCNA